MGWLFEEIRRAVREERFFFSWHADERCEERGITGWQIVAGIEEGEILEERPHTKPNPSVVVRQALPDGSDVEVIWSWLGLSRKAKLVSVYFRRRRWDR